MVYVSHVRTNVISVKIIHAFNYFNNVEVFYKIMKKNVKLVSVCWKTNILQSLGASSSLYCSTHCTVLV